MQENNSLNANFIIKKFKFLLGINTDVRLAKLLKIKPNTISTWKQRNSIDYKLIIESAQNHNLDLNELFFEKPLRGKKSSTKGVTPIIAKENILQYINNKLNDKLENLPHYNFILGEAEKNIAFQVSSNGLAPLIPEDSFVICDLSTINEIKKDEFYVVISKKYGFLISRIKTLNKKKFELSDIQSADMKKNYVINLHNISEIWKVIGISTYKPLIT